MANHNQIHQTITNELPENRRKDFTRRLNLLRAAGLTPSIRKVNNGPVGNYDSSHGAILALSFLASSTAESVVEAIGKFRNLAYQHTEYFHDLGFATETQIMELPTIERFFVHVIDQRRRGFRGWRADLEFESAIAINTSSGSKVFLTFNDLDPIEDSKFSGRTLTYGTADSMNKNADVGDGRFLNFALLNVIVSALGPIESADAAK